MSTERINQLHERASECYLSGDYDGAVSAWREVLALDPGNEQALGGVRMAAQFVRHEEPAFAGAAVDVETELDRGLMVLDSLGGRTLLHDDLADGTTDRKPEPQAEVEELLADEGSLEGWDNPQAPVVEEGAFGLDPVADKREAGETISRAASELKRRVEDLLAEARAKAQSGERDEALSILARLSILDEDNADAAALRSEVEAAGASELDKVEQAIIEGVAAMEADRLDDAERHFRDALEMAPEHREATHYLEKVAERRFSGGEELLGGSSGESAPAEDAVPRAIGVAGAARSTAAASAAPSPKAPRAAPAPESDPEPRPASGRSRIALPPRKVLILGGVGALVVCAALGLPRLFQGTGTKTPPPKATAPKGPARRPAKAGPVPKPGAAATAPVGPETPEERDRAVAAHLATARSLMASGDIGEAVVAFNKALSLDPGNAEAKEGFADAAERYKAGKAVREAMDNIRLAFRDGEFTSGLRLAYRLPPSVDKAYADEVKVTGWYNLAVVALRAGDCAGALSNLKEALSIAPEDSEAKTLRDFASRYAESVKDRAFLNRVEALSFRPLPSS